MKVAIFPGSFDPFTKGHESVVLKALDVFDKIIIAIGVNTKKQSFYPIEKRKQHIESLLKD
jgi:pantetheine-phosphate adenylyltransferase